MIFRRMRIVYYPGERQGMKFLKKVICAKAYCKENTYGICFYINKDAFKFLI